MKKHTPLISLRCLAQILITVLVLISPLSFSTDKVSNFTYECPVSTGCSITSNRRIARQRQLTATLVSPAPSPVRPHRVTTPVTPVVKPCRLSSLGRAPPA